MHVYYSSVNHVAFYFQKLSDNELCQIFLVRYCKTKITIFNSNNQTSTTGILCVSTNTVSVFLS